MKKIYIVRDTASEYYFADKKSALRFKEMSNSRTLKEQTLYETFDDYKGSQKKKKKELLFAIKETKEQIDIFKSGYLEIRPEKAKTEFRTYIVYSKDIETILKDKKLPELVYYYEAPSFETVKSDFTTKEFEKQYLDTYTAACKKALMKYEGLKARLKDYKAELKQLRNEKPNKSANENADVQ